MILGSSSVTHAGEGDSSSSDDEETAEELEKAAKKAMEEAKKMLERARARREARKKGLESSEQSKVEGPEKNVGVQNVPMEELSPVERKRVQRCVTREERRRRRAEIRAKRAALRAKRGRPTFYFNWMITGALLEEDGGNRFTDRKSTTMAGLGLTMRGGGIIDNKHMIGGRLQTYVHLTKAIIDKYEPEYEFGGIIQVTMGPEYRYRTPFNMTFGFTLGLAFTEIDDDLSDSGSDQEVTDIWIGDEHYHHSDASDDRSVVSLALLGELGYEFRFGYWFGLQLELFGGIFHGFDDDARQVNNLVIGTSVGIGF